MYHLTKQDKNELDGEAVNPWKLKIVLAVLCFGALFGLGIIVLTFLNACSVIEFAKVSAEQLPIFICLAIVYVALTIWMTVLTLSEKIFENRDATINASSGTDTASKNMRHAANSSSSPGYAKTCETNANDNDAKAAESREKITYFTHLSWAVIVWQLNGDLFIMPCTLVFASKSFDSTNAVAFVYVTLIGKKFCELMHYHVNWLNSGSSQYCFYKF